MLREDYAKIWKSLSLDEKSVENIQAVIENECFVDPLFPNKRDDMEMDGMTDAFNDLHWFLEGDGDCKDMFSDESDLTVPINKTIIFPDTKLNDTISRRVKNLTKAFQENLSSDQLKKVISSIEDLYIFDANYIKDKYYLKNDYQLGKLKTKQKIITSLLEIR